MECNHLGCAAPPRYTAWWTEGLQHTRLHACGRHVAGCLEVGLNRVARVIVQDVDESALIDGQES